jgi:hypothetical protein
MKIDSVTIASEFQRVLALTFARVASKTSAIMGRNMLFQG